MNNRKIYGKIAVNLLINITLLGLIITVGPKLLSFFYPFVIAFFISMIANPLVRFMERKVKIVRKHGSAIIIIAVLAGVFGVLYLVGALIVKEVTALIENASDIAQAMIDMMDTISLRMAKVSAIMPEGIRNFFEGFNQDAENYLSTFLNGIELPNIPQVSNYVKNVANAILMMIITILATYFFIADRDQLAEKANQILPESFKRGYRMVVDNFKNAVGGYFKAQFKIMLVLVVIMFIAFEFMKVDYSFLLALGIAFLDFLPVFGTGAVFWPWAIVDLIAGNYLRAVIICILYLVCQLVKQILQPKMVGDSIGLNPFAALLFMFIGYRLGGVLGMIIGIPIGMVVVSGYKRGMFERIIRGFKIIMNDINEYRKY
ncbi:MAG: sporulation integral membrane protein YtvI [Lachnospiraceae bacterium]|nr:sporulation integral membrane protein YtvI [Lachnospiraceae bacterium]